MIKAPKKIRNDKAHRVSFKTIVVIAGLLLVATLGSSCTATFGDKFVADPQVKDQYRFKIYGATVYIFSSYDTHAERRIKEFMAGTDYTSYEIVWQSEDYSLNSYMEYTVKFSK
jgi:hypothetical protein